MFSAARFKSDFGGVADGEEWMNGFQWVPAGSTTQTHWNHQEGGWKDAGKRARFLKSIVGEKRVCEPSWSPRRTEIAEPPWTWCGSVGRRKMGIFPCPLPSAPLPYHPLFQSSASINLPTPPHPTHSSIEHPASTLTLDAFTMPDITHLVLIINVPWVVGRPPRSQQYIIIKLTSLYDTPGL